MLAGQAGKPDQKSRRCSMEARVSSVHGAMRGERPHWANLVMRLLLPTQRALAQLETPTPAGSKAPDHFRKKHGKQRATKCGQKGHRTCSFILTSHFTKPTQASSQGLTALTARVVCITVLLATLVASQLSVVDATSDKPDHLICPIPHGYAWHRRGCDAPGDVPGEASLYLPHHYRRPPNILNSIPYSQRASHHGKWSR